MIVDSMEGYDKQLKKNWLRVTETRISDKCKLLILQLLQNVIWTLRNFTAGRKMNAIQQICKNY